MQDFFLEADEKYIHFINILEGWNNTDLQQVVVQLQITERIMRLLFMELLDGNKAVCAVLLKQPLAAASGNSKIQKQ